MKAQEVRDFLACNAAKIRELHADIHRKVGNRWRSDEDHKAWTDACERFHKTYNDLAFPGGLEQAMTLLKNRDASVAEAALIYCELRPYYFRSGYHRSKFLRLLGHIPLPTHLETRLRAVKDDVQRRKMANQQRIGEVWRTRGTRAGHGRGYKITL